MDDESDADLYGDLLPLNRKNDAEFKKVEATNSNLRHENEQLRQQIEKLVLENRALAQDKKKLETNFSSLIKTAQTEMKRKDQTIAELRREKDSVVFRRGRNSRHDPRPQERNLEPRHEVQRLEPFEQSHEHVIAPRPSSRQSIAAAPAVEEITPLVIPDVPVKDIAVLKAEAEMVAGVPTLVPQSIAGPQTVFSKRHSSAVIKPTTETNVPIPKPSETVQSADDKQSKTLVSSGESKRPSSTVIKPTTETNVPTQNTSETIRSADDKQSKTLVSGVSKRASSAVIKPTTETNVPTQNTSETIRSADDKQSKTLVSPIVSTPEINPEVKIKKRITPVLVSEPTPRAVDQNKNKVISPAFNGERSTPKVATESRSQILSACDITTPKPSKSQPIHEVPVLETVIIPKSKIVTHVKASFDTSNSKTKDFKRRVSTAVKDPKPKPEITSKSPLQRNPSFVSETSCDGLRRPSNYDLMKRNIKHKYHSLDSPKKSDRSRRSRSRSVWSSRRRDRSKSSHRLRSDRQSGSRRKDSLKREEETFKRRSPSRRQSKVDRSPVLDSASKRDSSPARHREDLSKRKVSTYSDLQNFSPVLSSTAVKDSERKSSRDQSLLDNQVPSASKSKMRLVDTFEKSVGSPKSADKLNRKEAETIIETPKSKVTEPSTDTTSVKPTETVRVAAVSVGSPSTRNAIGKSPSKQTDAKRKSIEAVADSLAIKLTSTQTTETTTKTVKAFTIEAALKAANQKPVEEPKTQSTILERSTNTKICDVISALTKNIMPIPPRDFLTARVLADYRTPTASAENSTEVSQGKTMSPPDVPKLKSGHAPTSFSGIKLGGEPKHFSSPFTPMKVDIANEYMSFPSMITPLKATPVKADCVEEDSLDLVMRLQVAKNKDQLGNGNAVVVERTVTRTESEVQWKLHSLERSDIVDIKDKQKAKDSEGKADKTVNKRPDESVRVGDKVVEETRKKAERRSIDMEEGEITDDTNSPSPKEPERPMVTFFKKSKEAKANKTRTADAKVVVSPTKMFDLRQRLLARTECVAPPRKSISDYEIRLKSPFKTSPRVSSASVANRSSRPEAHPERLTYNDYPTKGSRSRSPVNNGRLSLGRSPTSMFLEKSPDRFESSKSDHRFTGPEKRSEHRSKSPRASDTTVQENASRRRQQTASSSRSRSPCDVQSAEPEPHRSSSHRKSPARLSVSNSRSRSPSIKPRSAKRPQRLPSVSQSRSKSPLPGTVRKSVSKPTDRSDRCHTSTALGHGRSSCKSPSRESRNGPSNVNDRLRRLAGEGSGGELPFRQRRSRFVVDDRRQDRSAGRSMRRSREKSLSRSLSPIRAVPQRREGRLSHSQESPRKARRGRDLSDSPSPERTTKTVTQRSEGRHSRSQESPRKAAKGRYLSDSPSPERTTKTVTQRNEGRHSHSQESPKKVRRGRELSDSPSPERTTKAGTQRNEGRHSRSQESPKKAVRGRELSDSPSPERTTKTVTQRSGGRHSRSQESPRKAAKGRDLSDSPSPERTTKTVTQRSEGRHSRSQESPKKAVKGRDLSDSPSPERMTKTVTQRSESRHIQSQESPKTAQKSPEKPSNKIGNDSSAPPFRRRRAVFKTDAIVQPSNAIQDKASGQMNLIERILDSDSGISEKNVSPVKSRAGTATPDQTDHRCSYAASNNLPDILATLDSNHSPMKSPPAQTVSDKPILLDELVNNLIHTTNPDMQKCLESVRASFSAPHVATENETAQPKTPATSNGFVVRKRRMARMLPQETPWPATKQSPDKLPASVSEPEVVRPSEVTLDKPCNPATKAPNEMGPVSSGKSTASSEVSPASTVTSNTPATTNGFPFSRRRRTVRMLPVCETTSSNPIPTKETVAHVAAQSPSLDLGRKSAGVTPTKPSSEFPILEKALAMSGSKTVSDVKRPLSAQKSSPSDREQNTDSERSKRTEKRKRDDSDEKPWKKRNVRIVTKRVSETSEEFARTAKSLFGTDTEEEEDFTVRQSEYVKTVAESSDSEDLFESEGEESEESDDDEWKPARSHTRKTPLPSPATPPPVQRIWPAKPEEPKRRTTVFLEELPKSSEKIIADLMNQANRRLSAKKKRRSSIKLKVATSKAPKSAEFVPTDDSD